MSGIAHVPKTAARIFIFGIGGESRFKSFLQSELDQQVEMALERYEKAYQ